MTAAPSETVDVVLISKEPGEGGQIDAYPDVHRALEDTLAGLG